MLTLALVVALVTQDATPLKADARATAALQTQLYAGDWLEVRGERQGWLAVYDHRHERPGYVRPAQVRSYEVSEASARDLAAVIDFVRDTPGQEALGIGYAALFLRAAPASAVGGELFDALGVMAERLGRRASSRWARPGDATLAAQLEVAASYGVRYASFAAGGRTRVCYDGEAFRRALALPSAPAIRARAALGLTEPGCVDPALTGTALQTLLEWQADVLAKADPAATSLPAWLADRLHIRRAAVQAELAYARARQLGWATAAPATAGPKPASAGAQPPAATATVATTATPTTAGPKPASAGAQPPATTATAAAPAAAAAAAVRELALVDKAQLADDDQLAYDEAAVRVGAVRAAAEPAPPSSGHGPTLRLAAGSPGQTCLQLLGGGGGGGKALLDYCTYAVVWPSSLRVSPRGDALTIAQSPLPGWTELVLIRHGAGGWAAQTLAPAPVDPELGYVEAAGWSPDGKRLLVAREARLTGPLGAPNTLAPWVQRSFQIVRADDLVVEKQAAHLDNFVSFRRWASADWHRSTIALR